MTVTYRFKLPEEQTEQAVFARAQDYSSAVYDLTTWLRSITKYPAEDLPEPAIKERNDIYNHLWEILREYNLDPFSE